MNIELIRKPSEAEYELVTVVADQSCECTEQMKSGEVEDTSCKPCAARSALNGIVTLAKTLAKTL